MNLRSSTNKKICSFINQRSSLECEVIKEEIDILFSRYDSNENVGNALKDVDIRFCKLAKNLIKNITNEINLLFDKNNFSISDKEWINYELILETYINYVAEYYEDKRNNFSKNNNISSNEYYFKEGLSFKYWEHVVNRLKKYSHYQLSYIIRLYSFNRRSVDRNTYSITLLAFIISVVSLLISIIFR